MDAFSYYSVSHNNFNNPEKYNINNPLFKNNVTVILRLFEKP